MLVAVISRPEGGAIEIETPLLLVKAVVVVVVLCVETGGLVQTRKGITRL